MAFFIIWILIANMWALNLIVGVVWGNNRTVKPRDTPAVALHARIMQESPVPRPLHAGWRRVLVQIVTSSGFELAVLACIALNLGAYLLHKMPRKKRT